MKVCFLLQRRFAYIGHDLAVHLKNNHEIKEFCGYVFNRPSYRFLTSQQEINYSSLLLDEDLHLQAKHEKLDLNYIKFLEKEYGLPNLWPYIEVDRVIRLNQFVREYPMDQTQYSHEEMMLQIQVRAKAIIAMLEKEKPDYLFCTVVGSLGGLLFYHIAKKMGIKVGIFVPTRIGTRFAISRSYENLTTIDHELDKLLADHKRVDNYDEAKKILEQFRHNPQPHDNITDFYLNKARRIRQFDFLLPAKLKIYFNWLVGRIKYFMFEPDKYDFTYVKTLPKIKDQIVRKLRVVRGFNDFYDNIDPDNEDFAFFPLHMEPEVALNLYGYWYVNQLEVVRQVARSLPIHFKLYVKDHPRMVSYRRRRYYKELKKIPNVKLVSPQINSLQFLGRAKIVTTITSSVGWEALQLKVPVVTFGDVFFNKLSSIKRCNSYENLPGIIQQQLEHPKYNEDELINYIGLILKYSLFIDLVHIWHRESDKSKKREILKPLADLIAKDIYL